MPVESVSVKNFKLLGDFSVEGLRRVTLLGGGNGCGKTTLLEAVHMCFNQKYSSESLPVAYPLRDADTIDDNGFARLSHGGGFSEPITASCVVGGFSRSVKMSPSEEDPARSVTGSFSDATKSDGGVLETPPVRRALVEHMWGEDVTRRITIHLDKNGYESTLHEIKDRSASPPVGWPEWMLFVRNGGLNGEDESNDDADNLSRLKAEDEVGQILEAVRLIDPKIVGLDLASVRGKPFVVAKVDGTKGPVFPAMLGAGVHKHLSLTLALKSHRNGLCLLDEITVGWHYSHLVDLWRMIFRVCGERNHQVIATTHSHEGIAAFAQAAKDEGRQDDACYIRLDEAEWETDPKRKIKPASYSGEKLWVAVHEMETEVR